MIIVDDVEEKNDFRKDNDEENYNNGNDKD